MMNDSSPKGPFCQSCGMPMERPDQFGTDAAGLRVNDYCGYCYDSGRFTQPGLTREEMISKVAGLLTSLRGMPAESAGRFARGFIPNLKRWKEAPTAATR